MIYDATAHPLLSAEAQRLGPSVIVQFNALAEELLGLVGTTYADEDSDRAARAVALEINHLVTLGPDAFVFSSISRGGRTWAYRGAAGAGLFLVNPIAREIVESLPSSGDNLGYAPMLSRRRGASA